MSLLCKLIDHKYGEISTREEMEKRNEQNISVKIQTKECSRCGYTKEDRVRTIVESGEEIKDTNENETNTEENTDLFSSNKSNSNYKKERKDLDNKKPRKDLKESDDDGVIILKQNENSDNKLVTRNKSNPVTVSCNNCEYGAKDTDKYRRSGDFCPECSGYLKIES